MRLGKLTALIGVIIISIAVLFGCSNDDKTVTPTITYGSLDDPEFIPVKTQIDGTVTGVINDILAGFDNLYVPPGDTSSVQSQLTPPAIQPDPDADPDVLIAIYENGWHFVYATYTGDVYYAEIKDSIRFEINDSPIQNPTPDVDFIHYIDNWVFETLNQDVSHIDYTGRSDFELADLDQNIAVINGNSVTTVEVNYFAVDTTLINLFSFTIGVTDINVPKVNGQWITGCPQSGVLNISLVDTFEWTGGDASGEGSVNWEVEVVFNNGTATVTATNGETTWRYDCEVCNIPS